VSDKTEEPTPRRLRKAREEGDSGVSGPVAQALGFVVAAALLPGVVRAAFGACGGLLRAAIRSADEPIAATAHLVRLACVVAELVVPIVAATAAAAATAQIVQTGGAFVLSRLAPRLARLDPIAGAKGLFSPTKAFAVARALTASAWVAWMALSVLRSRAGDIARTTGRVGWAGAVVASAGPDLIWRAAFVSLALGFVDLLVTRRAWRRRLRMSKDDVKREHRESEGDPHLKAARHNAHREMLAQATLAGVRHASVVVVNPTHLACALRYHAATDEAPVVLASGEGDFAQRIGQAARDWNVPVCRHVSLARSLVDLPVGEMIPEALYEAVAAILAEIGGAG
jgi:type III secretion protein U